MGSASHRYFSALGSTFRQVAFKNRRLTRRCFHQETEYGKSYGFTKEIRYFLQMKGIKAQSGPTCFKCENIFPKPKSTKLGRPRKDEYPSWTMFINKMTGYFVCTDTGHRGKWGDLKEYMNVAHRKTDGTEFLENHDSSVSVKIKDIWDTSIPFSQISHLKREEILANFQLHVIPISDLELYGVRATEDGASVIVPWYSSSNTVASAKHLSKGNPIGLKIFTAVKNGLKDMSYSTQTVPAKGYWSLVGLSSVPATARQVVLTMNEFDAMAVNSSCPRYKAISLPAGSTHLPLEVLPYLERFSEIILWFDNNLVSWESARQFAKKLNESRCCLVRPTRGSPSPLQALSQNLDIEKILSSAVQAEIKNIVSFNDLRGFVKDELINSDAVCGVKWKRFPQLTKKLKGHRRGELTVLTGPTGSGKTTFMSEYSLDLASQGVSTLWGSFEIQNVRLLKTMMKQFAGFKLENSMCDFDEVADKFQTLPINFMTYSGPQNILDVLHTMRQAAYVHDIQHIIIDNVQFMMGTMSKNNDRFTVQDQLIGEFRNFASSEHIHVTLVIHPRKEDSGLPLQISSIFGTAKATQESDNVLILQQIKKFENNTSFTTSYLEIVKNRYNGELGRVPLNFDPNSLCMSKLSGPEHKKSEKVVGGGKGMTVGAEKSIDGGAAEAPVITPPWFLEWKDGEPEL